MGFFRQRNSLEGLALEWLSQVAKDAETRIENGDLDFDDVLYRGREAALTLLDIFDKEGN